MKVFKYEIPVNDEWIRVDLPDLQSTQILRVECQDSPQIVCMWVFVDPMSSEFKARYFRVYGTGHEIPRGCKPVGSCLALDGRLVWHVMERKG